MTHREILVRLGQGDSIADVSALAGLDRAQFDYWWRAECRKRVPGMTGGQAAAGLSKGIRIERDRWGVPHVYAGGDADLFFGFGYATAQDRLFQLDFLRRKACGRLTEILGPSGLESDVLYRTMGLAQIAEKEWTTLPADIQALLDAYTAGINALSEASGDNLPIEFDLLDYRPEPWRPADSLAILGEFRWYLTVRFPVIGIPELAKRALGAGPLYQAFLRGEENEESILWPGEYRSTPGGQDRLGSAGGGDGPGSNNWVLAGSRTASGRPLVASDPHVPFAAVSLWHEIHLQGDSLQVAGVAQAGVPAVMIGRSRQVAWGITNNICSLRDLYQEKTDAAHPDCFLYDGQWEPARKRVETIGVKGAAPVHKTIVMSRNGPIVDEVLPPALQATGPVSLRWLGFEPCGWLTAMINMNRARNVAEFRAATRPWLVPTFNIVVADADGHIGMQTVGRIPIRKVLERGYRPGWDPDHQWAGLIPFEDMPRLADPPRGFVATANNRLAPDDFPYPLSGTWSMGYRARRLRTKLEAAKNMKVEDNQALQLDTHSGRALRCVPRLVEILKENTDARVRQACEILEGWDCHVEPSSVAAALFNGFFGHWCRVITAERFPKEQAPFVAGNAGGLAADLLEDDPAGWFLKGDRKEKVRAAFARTLNECTERLGPDMATWTWGRLHVLLQKHFLSGRGDLGPLLDRSGLPVRGDGTTLNSSTPDAGYAAWLGAGFRMVADLADPAHGMWMVEVAGTSGHPGSPHYDDQIEPWNAGQYHYLRLTATEPGVSVLELKPAKSKLGAP